MEQEFEMLELSRWVIATYPGYRIREDRLFAPVVEGLGDQERQEAWHALRAMMRGPRSAGDVQGLRRYIGRVRRDHPDPRLERIEFIVAVHDAAYRLGAANPVVDAVESMGWSIVPAPYASMAIELGLVIYSRVQDTGVVPIPMADISDCKDVLSDVELILMDFPGDEGWNDLFGVDWGLDPDSDPWPTHPIGRLATLVDRISGARPRLDGRPELSTPDDLSIRASRFGNVPRALLEMLECLPRTEPCCLEVYESIADTTEDTHLPSVERAAAVFVRTLGSPELAARSKLRAAVRRSLRNQPGDAIALGIEAFHAMSELGDREGASVAASLVSLSQMTMVGASPIEWLERAVSLARNFEHPLLQIVLVGSLLDALRETKDELGIRRLVKQGQALARMHVELEEILPMFEAAADAEPEPEPEPEPDLPDVAPDLCEVQRLVDEGRIGEGYEALSDRLGILVESHPLETIVERLVDYVRHGKVHGALEAWCCAAIAELLDDDEQWSVYKLRQMTIEDDIGVSETMLDAGFDYLPALYERDGGSSRLQLDPRGRATHCIVEAERALGEGAAVRARFWAERAQFYRDRIDR